MNDNDIIKALEICQKAKYAGDCKYMGCPARTKQGCRFYLRTDEDHDMVIPDEMFNASLDLIKRQKAEIEELRKENFELKDGYFQKRYEEAEHEELLGLRKAWRKSSMDYIDLNAEWEGKYKIAKSEAIKEFAERLKKNVRRFTEYDEGGWGCTVYVVKIEDIDNLVKEMTEETP